MNIKDIIEGHINEALNKNKEMSDRRMTICKACPLFKETTVGPICNPALWINAEGKTSDHELDGYVKGCRCRLNAKTKTMNSHCVIGKW